MTVLEHTSPNTLQLTLEEGQSLHHPMRFLRSRRFGARFIPPWPLRAPLGRLWHRAYFLSTVTHNPDASDHNTVTLTGLHPMSNFQTLHVAPGQEVMVSLGHLAGFITHRDRPQDAAPVLRSDLSGLIKPACWLLGKPIPCLFTGPVTLIFSGQGLRWRQAKEGTEFGRHQLVCVDTDAQLAVRPLIPQTTFGHLVNAVTFRSRVVVGPQDKVLIQDYQPEEHMRLGLLREFALHLLMMMLLGLMALKNC